MLSFPDCTKLVDEALEKMQYPAEPNNLYEPVRYILSLGGKRLRPSLVLMAANLFADETELALSTGLAVEIFHNFTLLHDDIMDKADVRRGKKTVHKIWNENAAILSGDAAMIVAYDQLALLPKDKFVDAFKVFNQTALEVCEGQQYDIDFETREYVSLDEYMEMIRLKTSVLIAASMQLGGIVAGASKEDQESLYEIGLNLGLAFQLQDDYLDVYSDAEKFGKATGGDILNNKKTYLLIKALSSGDEKLVPELISWIEKKDFDPVEKVTAVKAIYDQLGIGDDTQLAAVSFINNSIERLNDLNIVPEKKKPLEDIIFKMMYRDK